MKLKQNNHAYIDSQNLNLGIQSMGWKLDFFRFRRYLKEKYSVNTAYLFVGYIAENKEMYSSLQKSGFVLIFKPVLPDKDGKPKGNVDADLVLQAMIDYNNNEFDQAIIVTSDGDFYSLVKYLYTNEKLKVVMSPYLDTCSVLLQKTAREKIVFMDNLRKKLEYKRKNTA
ncbi:MAG: NYN domain-containing protein [Candidatus Buchananbacteria bacterium]|nr:NYN domain-containing protein [Candidatus Buchananbacteria bacterium]